MIVRTTYKPAVYYRVLCSRIQQVWDLEARFLQFSRVLLFMTVLISWLGSWGATVYAAEVPSLAALQAKRFLALEEAQRPLKTLAKQYRAALVKRKEVVQAEGDLKGVLAVEEALSELENENFESNAPKEIPKKNARDSSSRAYDDKDFKTAKDVPKDPKVAELRETYIKRRGAMLEQVKLKLLPMEKEYDRYLGLLVESLTKSGAIEEAKQVEAIRQAQRASGAMFSEASVGAPVGFSLIPGGSFEMGDTFSERHPNERPVHRLNVKPFYMAQCETTKELWCLGSA